MRRRHQRQRRTCLHALVSAFAIGCALVASTAPISGASSPVHTLRRAVEHVLAQHSAKIDMTMSLAGHGTSTTIVREAGAVTFTSPIEARLTTSVVAGTTGKKTKVPVLLVGRDVYLRANGTWYELSASAVEAEEGISGSIESGSPAAALGLLYQEGAAVTRIGRRHLDGVTTTEYRAVIDFAKKFKPPKGVTVSPQFIANLKKLTGSTKLALNVWIDPSGTLRQESFSIPMNKSGLKAMGVDNAPKGIKLVVKIGLSHFGVAVTVKAPSTAQPLPLGSGTSTNTKPVD